MCGIFGFSEMSAAAKQMAGYLAWAMEDRGKDSWGATDGTNIIKHLGPITESWELPEWERGIFHTRARSVGAATLPNAHPFEFRGEAHHIVGIHNGCVLNHDSLDKKYERSFEVDSMHIFAHLAEGKSTDEIDGWGALAWYQDGALKLARFNTEALAVAKLEDGAVVFASTQESIRKAAKMVGVGIEGWWKTEAEHVISVEKSRTKGWFAIKGDPLRFGFRYARTSRPVVVPWIEAYSDDGEVWRQQYRPATAATKQVAKYCFKCCKVEVDRKYKLLCEACLKEVKEELENASRAA